MSRVNIVYTNGVNSYKVYWVEQRSNDIYHGFYLKVKGDLHWSHHKDGNVHITKDGERLPLYKSIAISEIKDIYNLINFNAGDEEWAQKYYPLYNNKKMDNIVWIDTRLFPNDIQIQVELCLVKPEYISVLSSDRFRKIRKNDYRLIQIIQDINPWLIVHVRNLKGLE